MRALFTLTLALLLLVTPNRPTEAQEHVELRFATLAPEGSLWMRIFRAWDEEIREGTEGRVSLRIYSGGSQGREADYLAKMETGQLDGASLTSTGLSQIVRSVLALSVPGLVPDYETSDRVRRRLGGRFVRRFEREGYALMGWGSAGRARMFSNRVIQRPQDFRSARTWAPRGDIVFSSFLSEVGATPRRLGIGEVYGALQTGTVDTVPGSALAALALQWHTHLRYVSEESTGILLGATVIRSERLNALSESDQEVIRSSSRRASRLLRRGIRREDDRAFQRLRLTRTPRDPQYDQEWIDAAERTRDRLIGRAFSQQLYDAVQRAAQAPE